MPNVSGLSLRDRLLRERMLPVDEAVRIATEVARALDHAHRHGVGHRDIKPESIMLQDGHALVAHFGIGKAVSGVADTTPERVHLDSVSQFVIRSLPQCRPLMVTDIVSSLRVQPQRTLCQQTRLHRWRTAGSKTPPGDIHVTGDRFPGLVRHTIRERARR